MTSLAERQRRREALDRQRRHYMPRGIPSASTQELTTNGAVGVVINGTSEITRLTTSGSQGAENVTISDGTEEGFEKIVELKSLGHADDVVTFTSFSNIKSGDGRAITELKINKEERFVMFRWTTGAANNWRIIRSSRSVTITVG